MSDFLRFHGHNPQNEALWRLKRYLTWQCWCPIVNPLLRWVLSKRTLNLDCRWNLVHWCNKSRRWQKSDKKWGSACSFWRHSADKYGFNLGPFGKNRPQPKPRPKGEIFSMMQVVSHRIWFKCILYPLMYQKNAFLCPCFYFMLQSRLNLDTRFSTRYSSIRTLFSKIAKKLNIDLCQFFSHWKEALFLLKSWNKKWGSPYLFLRQSCRKCTQHAFSLIIERGLARVSNSMYVEGGRRH